MSDSPKKQKRVGPVGIERDPGVGKTLARGRSSTTPFLLLGGVAVVVWSAVGLLSLAALLIWWLV